MPAFAANSSTARCGLVPMPGEPKVNSPGFPFANATRSLMSLIGDSARTTIPKV
jgi:hypothetical protein